MTDDRDEALERLRQTVFSAKPAENIVDLNTARRDRPAPEPPPPDPPEGEPSEPADDGGGPGRKQNGYGLPDGCPVTPLGKHGQRHFYLDALHQLIELGPRDHSRNHLSSLFAPRADLLVAFWPRKQEIKEKNDAGEEVKKWVIVGFKAEKAGDALMAACARLGVWDPKTRVRGLGAWEDDDGSLIYHCGNGLYTAAGEMPTGSIGRFVYPAEPAITKPHDGRVPCSADDGPAHVLYQLLCTWNYERPSLDPWLLLGWIAAAFVGGALKWRPMIAITGDTSTGKTTLHELIRLILGDDLVSTADCTASGLTSALGLASLAVAIDELEADADNKRQQEVIRLMRIASSGDRKHRGSSNQKGVEFEVRSCFMVSAILIPPLEPQDRSRMAILRLKPIPRGQAAPVLDKAFWRDIGRRIKRRMFDQWPALQEARAAFEMELARAGHSNRACNQFGALLACAHVLSQDEPPDAEGLAQWAKVLDPKELREIADQKSNAEDCLDYLCQAQPEMWRGGSKQTVSGLVEKYMKAMSDDYIYQESLASAALAVVKPRKHGGRAFLAVPNSHRLVAQLFDGSAWAGAPGRPGGWGEALGRLEGAMRDETAKVAGKAARCTLIPVEQVYTASEELRQREDA